MKPYTAEVRRDIDWELVDRASISCSARKRPASRSFSTCRSPGRISRTCHRSALRANRASVSSATSMEGDAIVGRMLDALQSLGLEQDTIVIFASDNGPQGEVVREFTDMQDMGSPGPTAANWATRAKVAHPHRCDDPLARSDLAGVDVRDVLDHGFLPDTRPPGRGQGAGRPPDRRCRPDGALLGASATGRRDALLTFIGPELVAVRWKQFRTYFADVRRAAVAGAARTACRGRGAARRR